MRIAVQSEETFVWTGTDEDGTLFEEIPFVKGASKCDQKENEAPSITSYLIDFIQHSRPKAVGLRLYIDDCGTGYSSLSYLLSYHYRLLIDGLKIDLSFINGMGHQAGTSGS